MKKQHVLGIVWLLALSNLYAARDEWQHAPKENPYTVDHLLHKISDKTATKISFAGYVKWETFWDTRQMFEGGAGQFSIFPRAKDFDPCCKDINDHSSFNMSAIETRIRVNAIGPDVRKAHSLAAIEFDFWGNEIDLLTLSENVDSTISRIRMRLAYLKLEWEHTSMLAG